jgi:hypothetical protein
VVASIFIVYYVEKHHVHGSGSSHETTSTAHRYLTHEPTDEFTAFVWKLNWGLLALNLLIYVCMCAWVLLKWHFVHTDVEHWLKIAEHISSGQGDDVVDNILDIHHMTRPAKHWGLHLFHKNRVGFSSFLHFGGHKNAVGQVIPSAASVKFQQTKKASLKKGASFFGGGNIDSDKQAYAPGDSKVYPADS